MSNADIPVHIDFFGSLKIVTPYGEVTENQINSIQICKFIAYLILNRNSIISSDILTAIIWPHDVEDPYGSLRSLAFRTRKILKPAFPGESLIIAKNGSYTVSKDFNLTVDSEILTERINMISANKKNHENFSDFDRSFIENFKGSFLECLSSDPWGLPVCTFYNSRFLSYLYQVIDFLFLQKKFDEIIQYAAKGLEIDPLSEKLHSSVLSALLCQGNRKLALDYYSNTVKMFENEYNILPTASFTAIKQKLLTPD